ncbi:hypothetical protein JXA02_12175, partial [candidate division KSB1 bacterium]|nr:hypothetical protein [candidate division KSB1 bacterium]
NSAFSVVILFIFYVTLLSTWLPVTDLLRSRVKGQFLVKQKKTSTPGHENTKIRGSRRKTFTLSAAFSRNQMSTIAQDIRPGRTIERDIYPFIIRKSFA